MLQSPRVVKRLLGLIVASSAIASVWAAPPEQAGLIVVEDLGGDPALPYYRALNLLPEAIIASAPPMGSPPSQSATDGDMLPVRSTRLTPGDVVARAIRAPGLPPTFVIGDDPRSRNWLQVRSNTLRELGAVGLVVNVDSPAALKALRKLAPGVTLAPTSGDDLAERLGLQHYPALITATGIEP
ncbi:integrating conjugative element protein [Paraburkholderia aspalathi]|uniref:Integrating conjugative element protein, PFL_4695 family n=1 Tax=Paraburkholderia aspalathi TaxID=1324617 RepID=A0A1I7AAX6_9BURK|nr:integrating conjugative element protein [Paraburkholderia aspalathi]SFT72072.1 integrating conjugative element protein, PFL_4695 family [Paraburkholderia aspalathi]